MPGVRCVVATMLFVAASSVAVGEQAGQVPAQADPVRLAKVPVVLRVRLIAEQGGDKYCWDKVELLAVLKNTSGEKLAEELTIAHYGWCKGIPAGECTVYLEPYNPERAGLWALLGRGAEQGVSHASEAQVESEPVRVNGVDLQAVADARWRMPEHGAEREADLGLRVTNRTDKPLPFNLFDTVWVRMNNAAGKALQMDGGRNGTRRLPPLLVEVGKSQTVSRKAKLVWGNDRASLRLIGYDGTGGVWYFDALGPGKYTIRFDCENTQEAPVPQPGEAPAPPYWIGQATTQPVTIEILPAK